MSTIKYSGRPPPANHYDDEDDEGREDQEREQVGTSTTPLKYDALTLK